VCISQNTDQCAKGFEFMAITKQTGLDTEDGILGLSPDDEAQNGPSYIKALKTEGIIARKMITFYLGQKEKQDGKCYFGGYPEDMLKVVNN
jgi:Eukaryotic aspartyl protease